MKGIRFYLEHASAKDKRKGNHTGNVLAVFYKEYTSSGYDAMGAVFFYPNSPVGGTTAGFEYLRTQCKRISEAKAREIHPELFKRLDD